MGEVKYKPIDDRPVSTQYRDLLEYIYVDGVEREVIHGEAAKTIFGAQIRYEMANGFPVITERDLSVMYKGAIAEHIAFLNGARTLDQLTEMGVPKAYWERWVTAEKCAVFGLEAGDLGDGSYGAAWTAFPTAEGLPFDQVEHLVRQIRERPFLRTHRMTPWIPQYTLQHSDLTRRVVVAPCHGDIHVLADAANKELSVHHFQRSGDFPVGVQFNMVQYAAFGMMLARVLGDYMLKDVVFTFSDVHIYESQYPFVEELLNREPRRLGTMAIVGADGIANIKDFRKTNFELSDYDPHPKMTIPTPV
ncbi:MAG: thymidylate synthase [Patescibacteria group bacterium]